MWSRRSDVAPGGKAPGALVHGRRWQHLPIKGGHIVENVVQALCRDIFAEAMLRTEEAGLPVVLHVHDELVAEVPLAEPELDAASLVRLITVPPDWLPDIPLAVRAFASTRYRK